MEREYKVSPDDSDALKRIIIAWGASPELLKQALATKLEGVLAGPPKMSANWVRKLEWADVVAFRTMPQSRLAGATAADVERASKVVAGWLEMANMNISEHLELRTTSLPVQARDAGRAHPDPVVAVGQTVGLYPHGWSALPGNKRLRAVVVRVDPDGSIIATLDNIANPRPEWATELQQGDALTFLERNVVFIESDPKE